MHLRYNDYEDDTLFSKFRPPPPVKNVVQMTLEDYSVFMYTRHCKVGRAPAALNFAADTGWDTDWLRLERALAPKWRTLAFENGNKKRPINHYTVVAVDFCV